MGYITIAIVDNSVTVIMTNDKSLFPILSFGRMEKTAIAAEAPQIATEPALKRPKFLFFSSMIEKKYPNKIVNKIRNRITIKETPPNSVILSKLNLKPRRLIPSFKIGSEVN